MPRFSIIIPIYNAENTIEECVASLLNQTFSDIEVICVDDCSKDNSKAVIEKMMQADERLKLLCNEVNQGTLISRKRGVLAASGEYIAFADGDDWYDTYAFEVLAGELDKKPSDIILYATRGIDKDGKERPMKELTPIDEEFEGADCLQTENKLMYLWNKCFSAHICKKAYEGISDVYMTIAEDTFANIIMHYYADSLRTIPNVLYNWRVNNGVSTLTRKRTIEQFEGFCKSQEHCLNGLNEFFEKNHYAKAEEFLEWRTTNTLRYCINIWKQTVSQEDEARGLEILLNCFGMELMARGIKERLYTIDSHKEKNKSLKKELKKTKAKLSKVKSSYSYRIGRKVTYIPRKLKMFGGKKK